MKVLVTGAGSLCGQGIIRGLRAHHERVSIVAVDPSPYAVGLHWADAAYKVPMAVEPGYQSALGEIVWKELPDLVMVGTDVELPKIAGMLNIPALVSPINVIDIADDKWLTYNWLHANHFNPPKTCLLKDAGKEMTFPFIAKPRIGGRSRGVRTIMWWGDMDELMKTVDASADTYISQERIDGWEYTAGALVFPGQEIASIVMMRDLQDGNTYTAWSGEYREYNSFVKKVAEKLQPYGPCNFQFRVDREGNPRIFEINARFSGTTPFRRLAGFPEVSMCLDYQLRGKPITQPEIKPMTIRRHWEETVLNREVNYDEAASRAAKVS